MAPLPRTGHRLRARLDFQPRLRAARTAPRGPSMPEPSTSTGALARLGFSRSERVRRFLAEPALSELGDRAPSALGATADGDDALLGLLRVAEAAQEAGLTAEMTEFLRGIGAPGSSGQRLITLLGTSVAMGDFLTRHPERLSALRTGDDQLTMTAHEVRATLLRAVGADPAAPTPVAGDGGRAARDHLRIAYHERLLQIAAADVRAPSPTDLQPRVSEALSDLARSEEHTSELQSRGHLVCRLLLEKKNQI